MSSQDLIQHTVSASLTADTELQSTSSDSYTNLLEDAALVKNHLDCLGLKYDPNNIAGLLLLYDNNDRVNLVINRILDEPVETVLQDSEIDSLKLSGTFKQNSSSKIVTPNGKGKSPVMLNTASSSGTNFSAGRGKSSNAIIEIKSDSDSSDDEILEVRQYPSPKNCEIQKKTEKSVGANTQELTTSQSLAYLKNRYRLIPLDEINNVFEVEKCNVTQACARLDAYKGIFRNRKRPITDIDTKANSSGYCLTKLSDQRKKAKLANAAKSKLLGSTGLASNLALSSNIRLQNQQNILQASRLANLQSARNSQAALARLSFGLPQIQQTNMQTSQRSKVEEELLTLFTIPPSNFAGVNGILPKFSTLLVNLLPHDREYVLVKKQMLSTVRFNSNPALANPALGRAAGIPQPYKISQIQKIQNRKLWDKYCRRKEEVSEENSNQSEERMLFHGSRSSTDAIIQQGFDERYALAGGLFFAEHSSKSNQYNVDAGAGCPMHKPKRKKCSCRHLLLCRVTLGNPFVGPVSCLMGHAPPGSHSVILNFGGLTYPEYIIYRGEQAYPAYLITYQTVQ